MEYEQPWNMGKILLEYIYIYIYFIYLSLISTGILTITKLYMQGILKANTW